MKKFVECITPEQKKFFKTWYLYDSENCKLIRLVENESVKLTAENFKIVYSIGEKGLKVADIYDIGFYAPELNDFDFEFIGDCSFFYRDTTPLEVVEFLDKMLDKAQYENKE